MSDSSNNRYYYYNTKLISTIIILSSIIKHRSQIQIKSSLLLSDFKSVVRIQGGISLESARSVRRGGGSVRCISDPMQHFASAANLLHEDKKSTEIDF